MTSPSICELVSVSSSMSVHLLLAVLGGITAFLGAVAALIQILKPRPQKRDD